MAIPKSSLKQESWELDPIAFTLEAMIQGIFHSMEQSSARFQLKISFMSLQGSMFTDLINDQSEIHISDDRRRGIMTSNAEEILINEHTSFINIHELLKGWNQKKPSGAHSILSIVVEQ
jgi:hypothetical protein